MNKLSPDMQKLVDELRVLKTPEEVKKYVDNEINSCRMGDKKEEKPLDPTEGNGIMKYIIALPGGAAITAFVMLLIHYGSILTVGM